MSQPAWNQLPASIASEVKNLRGRQSVYILAIVIALFHLWANSLGNIDSQNLNILHFAGFILLSAFLGHQRKTASAYLSFAFAILVTLSSIYLMLAVDSIYDRGLRLNWMDWITGSFVIIGAIEFVRRATGWLIPIMIILALSYIGWWGAHIPGVFRFAGLSPDTLLFRSLYGDDALFGNITQISASFVFVFMLFGAFLLRSGAGDVVIKLAGLLAGRMVGGSGIVAVIASGITGTISGSAIANTVSTGVITIPMMKKAGFSPRFAAAVEAASSTGGQLMPPIMGAGAFVMASYTQIPYSTIVAASIIPALLYFLSLGFYIRLEAKKLGLKAMPNESSYKLGLDSLTLILPISLLLILLSVGFTPVYAGFFAILSVIASSWLTPNKMGLRAIMDALALGAKNMTTTAILLCAVGLIVNVIVTAGIGNTFSLMITEWAGGSLLLGMLLVAIASLILGMGLPVTASYIVLATLSAPALFNLMANNELLEVLSTTALTDDAKAIISLSYPAIFETQGILRPEQASQLIAAMPHETLTLLRPLLIDETMLSMVLLASHLIIFWLSQDSNVTPPVCLCAYTAAGIAQTSPMATGLTSWKIAKALYIVPLLFAYSPLISGNLSERLLTGLAGVIALYLFTKLIYAFSNNG